MANILHWCEYCHQEKNEADTLGCKTVKEYDEMTGGNLAWDPEFEKTIELSQGYFTQMIMWTDKAGRVVMSACGDEVSNYFPKYCPECGRKLRD